MKHLTKSQAEQFYADAFAICHRADYSDGRWLSMADSDEVSAGFQIQTPHGILAVSVLKPEFLVSIGYGISLRFKDRPDIYPEVCGSEYDKFTGKWNIHSLGKTTAEVLTDLAARLDWAQGIVTPPPAPVVLQQEMAFA